MPAGLARWQMPQGGIDTGEAPRLAALRELKEEIGTDAVSFDGDMTLWDFEKVMRVTRRGIGRTSVHRPKATFALGSPHYPCGRTAQSVEGSRR
jgi:8-oxo-dGTP pyrophosphatase MutT (NUDIX family)